MSSSSLSASLLLALCLAAPAGALGLERTATPVPITPTLAREPAPVIDVCRCTGTVFDLGPSGLTTRERVEDITQPFQPSTAPNDTCPIGSRLDVSWHAERGGVQGWEYALSTGGATPTFTSVNPGVRSVSFDLGALLDTLPGSTGRCVFWLRAIGPKQTIEVTRMFQLNLTTDTWWSGPDSSSLSLSLKPNGEKYALIVAGQPPTIPGSLLSPDSAEVIPVLRTERRSFFEVWKDTVFVRQEGDTVHLNAWVILHNGGLDPDSPYSVIVTDAARAIPGLVPDGPVLVPGPANGSPIGFRSTLTMSLTPSGQPSRTALSGLYPLYDPNSVFMLPRIGGYRPVFQAGRAFAVAQAEDANGDRDRRVQDGRELVLKVEAGTATPYEQSLRSKVLTFEVDRAPWFVTGDPAFSPTPQQVFTTSQWPLHLVAFDEDPYLIGSGTPPGGPSTSGILRRRIRVHGQDANGNPFTYVDPLSYVNQQDVTLTVPAALAPGPCTIEVELCDCDLCEDFLGMGRCVTRAFPVLYQPPGAPAARSAATLAPTVTALFAPYPNPASRGTTIRFDLARGARAELEVFSLSGARVRTIVSETLPAGAYAHAWSGESDRGERVAEGLYFVRLRAGEFTATKKVLMSR